MARMPEKMPLGVLFSGRRSSPGLPWAIGLTMTLGALVLVGLAAGVLVPR